MARYIIGGSAIEMIRRVLSFSLVFVFASLAVLSHLDAQDTASPRRIGVLFAGSWTDEIVQGFRQGLHDAGYVEGRDIVIDWRPAKGNYDLLPRMAAELVQSKVDVIVVGDTPSARAVKQATTTIPVVLTMVADPVGSGLVMSLAHPGSNITGLTIMAPDLSAKRLELLKEALPFLRRVTVFWNPNVPYHPKVIEELKAAAPALSIDLTFVSVRTRDQFGPAFSAVSRAHAQALYVIDDALFSTSADTILQLSRKARVPVIYASREYVRKGALMHYGPSLEDQCRRAGGYVGKILKGSKPNDMPIERPAQFELMVNLKTAKALGINLPESILLRADEVIH